jgi:hypothetical protein
MVEFDLHRLYINNGDGATIGILLSKARKAKYWFTIERPLFFKGLSNQKRETCIPIGSYTGELFASPKFKKSYYELQNVKNRDKILIHPANTINDLNGCIGLGLKIEKNIKIENVVHEWAIVYSAKATNNFYSFCNPNFDYQGWYDGKSNQTPNKIKVNIFDNQDVALRLIRAYQKDFKL